MNTVYNNLVNHLNAAVSDYKNDLDFKIDTAKNNLASLERQKNSVKDQIRLLRQTKDRAQTNVSKRNFKIIGGVLLIVLSIGMFALASGSDDGTLGGVLEWGTLGLFGIMLLVAGCIAFFGAISADQDGYSKDREEIRRANNELDRLNAQAKEINVSITTENAQMENYQNELNHSDDWFFHKLARELMVKDDNRARKQLENALDFEIREYNFSHAHEIVSFLERLFPEKDKYGALDQRIEELLHGISDVRPYVMTSQYGRANKALIEKIILPEYSVVPNNSYRSFLELFWKAVLCNSGDEFILQAVFAPFIKLYEKGYLAVDYIAGVVYLSEEIHVPFLGLICPHFDDIVVEFNKNGSGDMKECIASFCSWCGLHEIEHHLLAT